MVKGLVSVFPTSIRPRMRKINWDGLEEIRVRIGWPVVGAGSGGKALLCLRHDQLAILRQLGEEPMQVDDIIELTGIPTRRVLSALTVLEMDELVIQHSGKRYTRAVTLTE